MRKRVLWVVAYVVAIVVFVAGVVVLVRSVGGDEAETSGPADAAALASMPFPATLGTAGLPSTTTVGTTVPITVGGVSGAGIATVELYDDDRLVATVTPPAGAPSTTVSFPALTPGVHALSAQVTDGEGQVSQTPVAPIDVAPAAVDGGLPVPVTAQPDQTPAQLAEQLGVEPQQVVATAPDAPAGPAGGPPTPLDPDEPIPAGGEVVVVVGPDQPPAPPRPDLAETSDLGDLGATVDGCDVTVTGPRDTTVHEGTGAGWRTVGTTTGDGTVSLASATPGQHVYMVRGADDGAAVRRTVTVPPECAEGVGWTGDVSIVDGVLHVPALNGSGARYLYLTVEGATVRVPAAQDAYLQLAGLATPIADLLPPLAGRTLDVELWRVASDVEVRKEGEGHLAVPEGRTLAEVVGEPQRLTLTGRRDGTDGPGGAAVALGGQDGVVRFRWEAASTGTTRVLWQLLVDDRPTSDHDLTPDGLLAVGVSEAAGGASSPAGEFTIDTGDIPGREATGEDAFREELADLLASFGRPDPTPVLLPKPGAQAGDLTAGSFASAKVPTTGFDPTVQVLTLPGYGDPVYVRVLPIGADGAGTGATASPTVAVTLPVPQGQDGTAVDFTVDEVAFDPGRRVNEALAGCVRVDVPWNVTGQVWVAEEDDRGLYVGGSYQPAPDSTPPPDGWTFQSAVTAKFYPTDGTYCATDFPPPADCSSAICDLYDGVVEVVSAVGKVVLGAYSLVSGVYNGVINGIVEIVSKYSGLCAALGAVGGDSVEGGCQGLLAVATRAAITAVLAAFGLPPSLPTVDQLESVATGNLETLVVAFMQQYVPCDELSRADPADAAAVAESLGLDGDVGAAAADPCLALARGLVGLARDAVNNKISSGVAQATGLPSVAGIPGASMVLEPKGQIVPMSVRVKMHPTESSADATGIVCPAEVSFSNYPYLITPHIQPFDGGVPPGQFGYPFTTVGPTPAAAFGTWAGDLGVGDFYPGSSPYYNSQDPITAKVSFGGQGSRCRAEPRTVTVPMRPEEPR
jgi:hypothetical protein